MRRQRPFSSPRRGSVASCSPLFPTNDSALSGIPKGMTRVRVVIRRLAKKEEPLAFADSLGTEERSNPSFAHRGGVVINRRAYGERERERYKALYRRCLSGTERRDAVFDRQLLNRGMIVIMITEVVIFL